MSEQLKLQSVQKHIGADNLANMLECNLKMYYDWAMLCIGGWSDVPLSTINIASADLSSLRSVDDPNYFAGQVWEAPRKDFVWETNIDYVNVTGGVINPLVIGVPTVNSTPTSQSYTINYLDGKVIFDNPESVNDLVNLAYAYRYVQIYRADEASWWKELQFNSHRINDTQFHQLSSGTWSMFGQYRVQLPAVIIESVPRGTSKGYELGSSSKEASRDVLFHIYAENGSDRNNLMDIFNLQTERQIPLFNSNDVIDAGAWPLDWGGSLVNSIGFPEFVSATGYQWRNCLMKDSTISNVGKIHPNLYNAVVRTTMSVIV